MKILLVQVDGKMPNIALMKISSYYKERGHETGFGFANPDKVYVSCIFSENLPHARGITHYYPDAEFHIGGPSLERPNFLPPEMEHVMPDYSLYPDMDYSLGFTTRGCIRNCAFCIVPKVEGKFREYCHPGEWHNPDFKKIVFFDNNFLVSKNWKAVLEWIQDSGLKGCFNQGLDARLVTEEKAQMLADTRLYNLKFGARTYYFSWDFIENEEPILRGLNLMIDVGVSRSSLMIYVLVGYNTTHEQDLYRFKKLREMGADPFIMVYNHRKDDKWINHFARYVNKRIYKSSSLEDYRPYNLRLSP